MKIFDAHAHLGYDVVFDVEVTEEGLLSACRTNGVDGALVQPFLPRPYLKDTMDIHDRIWRLTKAHPGKFYGMISICPHLYPEEVEQECRRCVRELDFRGIKIATTAHGVNPASRDGLHIFDIARELSIPVMIHTGGGSFGDPLLLEKPASLYPDVKLVVAHGGGESGIDACIRLAAEHENVYVEPSWVNLLSMEKMARMLGAEKIMFSSDMPQNLPAELAIFRAVFPDEAQREAVFHGTAAKVFGL